MMHMRSRWRICVPKNLFKSLKLKNILFPKNQILLFMFDRKGWRRNWIEMSIQILRVFGGFRKNLTIFGNAYAPPDDAYALLPMAHMRNRMCICVIYRTVYSSRVFGKEQLLPGFFEATMRFIYFNFKWIGIPFIY